MDRKSPLGWDDIFCGLVIECDLDQTTYIEILDKDPHEIRDRCLKAAKQKEEANANVNDR